MSESMQITPYIHGFTEASAESPRIYSWEYVNTTVQVAGIITQPTYIKFITFITQYEFIML